MNDLEQKIFDFVNKWEVVSEHMLYRQRFMEEPIQSPKNAIDNLVRQGIMKRLGVQIGDKLTYVLFPANTVIQL